MIGKGLPAITPEPEELKESGAMHRAKMQLMSPKSTVYMQQRKYIDEMADEMGLVVFGRKKVKELQRAEKRLEKIERRGAIKVEPNGHSIMYLAHMLKPRVRFSLPTIRKPSIRDVAVTVGTVTRVAEKARVQRKKRQRLHTGRNGKTPRYLRKRINDGQKTFSFPDHIWKVRAPRKRRKRR